MGQIDWNTPPTESEVLAGFDTPPTESEMKDIYPMVAAKGSVPSYEAIDTKGVGFPKRDIFDVLTGRGSSPDEIQQMINQKHMENILQTGGPEGMESVTPFADFFNPLVVPAKVAGAGLAGYGTYKAGQAVKNKVFPTTNELDTVANKMGISREEALNMVEGVSRKDQAFKAAEQGGDLTGGIMGQAITQDADELTKVKYAEILTNKKKAIEESLGKSDMESIKDATKQEYQAMKDYVSSMNEQFSFTATDYLDELKTLKRIAQDDATATKLKGIIKDIEVRPIQSVDDMIELKQGLNEIYRATKSKKRQNRITQLKDKIDGFLNSNIDEQSMKFIKDSEQSWSRMRTQEKALELLDKSSKTRGTGTKFERGATDWVKFNKLIKEEGLSSPEVDAAISVSSKFEKKFGDMDIQLFGLTRQRGLAPEAPTLANDPLSSLQVRASRGVFDWIMSHIPFTDKSAVRKAQNAIESSIRKSNTQEEFINNVITNKNTPESIRERMNANLDSQLIRPDIIDVETGKDLVRTPDIIDTEVIDPLNQIGGQAKKQLPFNLNGYKDNNMIPRTFDLQSDIIMGDKNFARPQTRDERIFNLKETTRPKPLTNSKGYKLPDDLNNNPFVEEALANGDINRANQVGLNRMETKGGLSRLPNGDEIYVNQINLPTDAIQTSLSSAAVKRIKKGQGTKDDFEALRIDAELLSMQEADMMFPIKKGLP